MPQLALTRVAGYRPPTGKRRRPFIRSITHPPDQTSKMNEKKLTRSSTDGENFVYVFPELAGAQVEKNQILGPVSVMGGGRVPSSVPLYLGKLVTELK